MKCTRNGVCLFRVIVVGDKGVGKSSIIRRYFDGDFKRTFDPTLCPTTVTKRKAYKQENVSILFQEWSPSFKSKIPSAMAFDAAVVVFDVTNPKSFENAAKWENIIREKLNTKIKTMLIANKSDSDERLVTEVNSKFLAKRRKLLYREVSAKSGENIQEAFDKLLNLYISKMTETKR